MESLNERFERHGQGHVFRHWDHLGEAERAELAAQAEEIDLDELDGLIASLVKGEGPSQAVDPAALEPAPYEPLPEDPAADPVWREARTRGEEALRAGKVAAFTVSGGQGTRLGYDGPKGAFPVSPVKDKTLFQLFAESVQAARRRYGCPLPWLVMTSHANHERTVAFFEERGHFGLEPESVIFFRQGRMPAVDFEGRIILEAPGRIAMSPDGHGGSLRALVRSGALGRLREQGVELLSYFQVDNPLVRPIDPAFIGFQSLRGSAMSSKMIPKAYPEEKVGHFCLSEGKLVVVEYSDMPEALAQERDEGGELRFRAGSIAIHLIDVGFVARLADPDSGFALPFHKAVKKIPFLASSGRTETPEEPNGIKFEMFVFDALPFAERPLVLETERLEDFSPVKNAEGVDSPETARRDQTERFARWLEAAGQAVPRDEKGAPLQPIEISPLYAPDKEAFLERFARERPEIDFSKPAYLE